MVSVRAWEVAGGGEGGGVLSISRFMCERGSLRWQEEEKEEEFYPYLDLLTNMPTA
jgi:hypothetical protein